MKQFLLLFISSLTAICASGQTQNFNVFTCTIPEGFRIKDQVDKLHLEKLEGKNYCQLIVNPVATSCGSIEQYFNKHWGFFARNPQQKVGDPKVREHDSSNGWAILFGAARGIYNKQNFAITVTTFTKGSYTYYIASVFTDEKYTETAQAFSTQVAPDETKQIQKNYSSNNIGNHTTATLNNSTITTEFDDGWTSTYIGPYVTVNRGELLAWIFPVNDSLHKVAREPEELLEDTYCRYSVNQFFQVRIIAERPWQMSGPGNDKIFEAEFKNKQTGEESFVAMRVIWNSGSAQPVLALAATKEQMYNSVFAQYISFEQVLVYNKFTVTPQLLRGTCRSSEVGATGSYSIAGGFYGGNAKMGFKDEFVFNTDGTYQSMHGLKQRKESHSRRLCAAV